MSIDWVSFRKNDCKPCGTILDFCVCCVYIRDERSGGELAGGRIVGDMCSLWRRGYSAITGGFPARQHPPWLTSWKVWQDHPECPAAAGTLLETNKYCSHFKVRHAHCTFEFDSNMNSFSSTTEGCLRGKEKQKFLKWVRWAGRCHLWESHPQTFCETSVNFQFTMRRLYLKDTRIPGQLHDGEREHNSVLGRLF